MDLADFTPLCSIKDPELEECMKRALGELVKKMEGGISDWDTPPFNPFFLNEVQFRQPRMQMNLTFINTTIYGLADIQIEEVKFDREKYTFYVRHVVPKEIFNSTYKVAGRFMLLPITGKGKSIIQLNNVNVTSKVIGEPIMKDGVKHIQLLKFETKIAPQQMKIHLENLFNGSKILGDTMNFILNNNWRDIFSYIQPQFESLQNEILFEVTSNIFSKVPFSEMFNDTDD